MRIALALVAVVAALSMGIALSQQAPSRGVVCSGQIPAAGGAFSLACVADTEVPTSQPTSTPTGTAITATSSPVANSPTSTPSATFTAIPTPPRTPSPTSTASPSASTPTQSATPSASNTLAAILADLTGTNPACIALTEGYDWGGLLPFSSVEKNGPINHNRNIPPSGATRITTWLMLNQEANCNGGAELSPNTNGTITVSGLRVFVLLSSGAWQQIDAQADIWGWQDNDPNYHGPQYASACCFNAQPPYTVPHNRGKQVYTAQTNIPSGVVGWLAVYNARSTGGALMANCGSDYYSSSGGYMGDLYVGKFHALGPVDVQVSCTNISAATLQANPPPIP